MVDKVVGDELSDPILEAKLDVMLDVMLDASGFTTENTPLWVCERKRPCGTFVNIWQGL